MNKLRVRRYAAANGVVAKYSGRLMEWFFFRNGKETSRGNYKLTERRLDNAFKELE